MNIVKLSKMKSFKKKRNVFWKFKSLKKREDNPTDVKDVNCPHCKENVLSEFDSGYICKVCHYIVDKTKFQLLRIVGQVKIKFSKILPHVGKKSKPI